ncbi:Fc.00g067920.m01.CDS01 [Cosmosporella sp. VM-42]
MLGLFILTVTLAVAPRALAIRSFSKGCQAMDGQFYGQDKVGFYCFTEDEELKYDYKYSTIDLRHCIGNNVGTLVGYDGGAYQNSCDNCTLDSVRHGEDTTCYLKCECYDMDEHKHRTELNLNDVLKDDDGRLVCFGHRGTRNDLPPECNHNVKCSTGLPRMSPRSEPTRAVRREIWA